MKHRLKGLLALVLSLVMVFATATSAWALEYNIYKEYDGNIGDEVYKLGVSDGNGGYTEVSSGTVFNEGDTVTRHCSGGFFVIKNKNNEYVGNPNQSYPIFDANSTQVPSLYAFDGYEFPAGKYLFKGFGNTGYVDDTNYAVSYIHLVPFDYIVSFNANGGSGTMEDQLFVFGEEKALTANAFTYAGYHFDSWNTAQDGSGTSYDDGALVKDLTATSGATVTLYAQWEEDTPSGQGPGNTNPYPPIIYNPTPTPEPEGDKVTSSNTFDGGIASAVVVTILSATGGAWLAKKKD